MNRIYLLSACFLLHLMCKGQPPRNAIVLEGAYRGKNLYIQNPHATGDSSYCTEKVTVNEKKIPFENSSAFEIRLNSLGLKIGDPLRIVIAHKDDCKPKVLNPYIDGPQYFDFKSIAVSGDSLLTWTTAKEEGKMPFVVEQFRWNKWVKAGEVESKTEGAENRYEFRLQPHSGQNMVRVKRLVSPFKYSISKSVSFTSGAKAVTYKPDQKTKQILFSAETAYEVYSQYGDLLKTGSGKTINCSELKPGMYFLNYDDKTGEFNIY